MPTVTVSVVSHGHGEQVMQLLCKLQALCLGHVGHVVLTINVPESTLQAQVRARQWAFELTLLQNPQPKGFGANHNAAFKHNALDYFCVVNPDIDFDTDPLGDLIRKLADPLVGCSFPVQVDAAGHLQDHARSVPSPVATEIVIRTSVAGGRRPLQPNPPERPSWSRVVSGRLPTVVASPGGADGPGCEREAASRGWR